MAKGVVVIVEELIQAGKRKVKPLRKPRYPKQPRLTGGFTLVELLIVIAIIGILAAIIVPNLSGLGGAGQTESAAAELSLLQSAMDTMMAKNGLAVVTATAAINNMAAFPSGNPLYPDYLRSRLTAGYYACTSSGLVLAAEKAAATTTPTPTLTTTTTATPAPTGTTTPTTTTTTAAAYPAWAADTAYQPGAYVTYNGGSFYARYYASENQVPGDISSPWQEVTDQWRNFNVYTGGDTIWYEGKQFEARNWTQNATPGLIASPWQELTDEWRDFNIYQQNDRVRYNGLSYKAKYYSQNVTPGTSDAWQLIS